MPSASTSQRNTRAKRLPAPPVDEITLRLVGTEQHGRLVRITAAKCTVGTAPGCTLRLKANGVAPMHLLILRGTNGVVVRRLAEGALLNGRPFDDAPLAAEDRLEIGSVTFVVVQVPLSAKAAAEELEATGPQTLPEEARELVRETRRVARRRARNLLNALRAGKRNTEQLTRLIESRKSELEQTARQTAILHRELTAQRDRQRIVEDEQRAAVLQVGQLTASLERLRHELLAAQSQRQSEADRWRLDRSRMTEDLALRDSRQHEAESQLQQKQWELEQLHLQFQRQQRQLELEHEQAVAARQRRDRDAETAQLEVGRISEELLAQDRARLQAESELQTARRELEQQRDALNRLRKEAAEDRAALAELRGSQGEQVAGLSAKLADEQIAAAKLRTELRSRTEELEQLRATSEQHVREWQVERLQIVKQVSEAAAHDAQLLTEHRRQLDAAAEQAREWEAQIATQTAALAAREAELAATRAELQQERRERQTEHAKALEAEQSVARVVSLTEDSRRRLTQAEENCRTLETLLAERDTELARLREDNHSQTIQWHASRERLSEGEVIANERRAAAEAELTALRGEVARQAAEFAAQLTAERQAQAERDTEISRLQTELDNTHSRGLQTLEMTKSEVEQAAARREAELAAALAAEQVAKAEVEREANRLREACETARRELQSLEQTTSALEEATARQIADLAAERQAKAHAELEAERLREELSEHRGREMQTMVFPAPQPEVPAIDPEETAKLEQQRQELAERAEQLARLQQELNAERESFATDVARSQDELRTRREHLAAESSRISAGMHQLQDFELRLVRQQDEFTRRQRELESQEAAPQTPVEPAGEAPVEPAVDRLDDEAGFLMPVDPTPIENVARLATAAYLPPESQPEILEPTAFEPPARAVTEPYFTPQSPAESNLIEPEVPAPEQPAEEQPVNSSAFERRLAALAAEAAKARAAMTNAAPEPEPPAEEEPVAPPVEEPAYEMHAPPAITPDLLPQWRFEHETPERMDTITGLRMRNLLDEIKSFPTDEGQEEAPSSKTLAEMMQQSTAKLAFEPTPAPQPEPPPEPVAEQPVEEIDIFSRLKEAGILKGDPIAPITLPPREEPAQRSYLPDPATVEDEPEEDASAYAERVDQTMLLPPSELPSSYTPAKQAEPAGEEEDSIENYMQQLLQRVRGDGPPAGTGTNPVYRAAAAPQATPAESPAAKKAPPPPPAQDLTPVKPEEYIPRSAAPELSVNLAAMRELANSQARSAIQTHQKKVGLKLSGGKLITSVVALVTAGVLIWSGSTNHIRLTVAAGGIGVVIGLYWLIQALFLSQGWVKSLHRVHGGSAKRK